MASEDDYSDLTELESDDYDESPSKSKKGTKTKSSNWKIRMSLKVPRATTYSAQALYEQIHAGDVNLEPPYQRDVVWPESKQIMVIDSIFRNFYIPPVIFAVKTDDDGSETKTCIDGKQRLTSIWKWVKFLIFRSNLTIVPEKIHGWADLDAVSGRKLYYKDNKASMKRGRYEIMPERYRKLFANKQIVCVEYHEISEDNEREVFQRVQLGMALTPAEKLQVIATSRAGFVRGIVTEYLREDGPLGPPKLKWKADRATDFRCLGHGIHIMHQTTLPTTTTKPKCGNSDLGVLDRWLNAKVDLSKDFKTSVEETYKIFASLVSSTTHSAIFTKYKTISPVEFIFIAVLIFVHKGQANKKQLAEGIEQMFDHVREEHKDVRMNNRVMKTMNLFITEWQPGGGLSTKKAPAGQKRKRAAATGTTKGRKKKKSDEEDDDMDVDEPEDEQDGTPAKTQNKSAKAAAKAKESPPVKTEPATPVLPSAPEASTAPSPKVDRLAGLRKTKAQIAQKEAERAAAAPTAPRALQAAMASKANAASANAASSNPTPTATNNVSTTAAGPTEPNGSTASSSAVATPPATVQGPSNGPNAPGASLSTSASASRLSASSLPKIPPIRIPASGHPLPAPPQAIAASPDRDGDRARRDSRDWDRDRDRGRGRGRSRDRSHSRERRGYDDRRGSAGRGRWK